MQVNSKLSHQLFIHAFHTKSLSKMQFELGDFLDSLFNEDLPIFNIILPLSEAKFMKVVD